MPLVVMSLSPLPIRGSSCVFVILDLDTLEERLSIGVCVMSSCLDSVFMIGRCHPAEVCLSALHQEAHGIDVPYYFDHLGDSSFQTLCMQQLTKMS